MFKFAKKKMSLMDSIRGFSKKELAEDLQIPIAETGNLSSWAKQGVLLLNATLTVRAKQAGSHQKKGWEEFTDAVIQKISTEKEGVIFLLWGRFAQNKAKMIDKLATTKACTDA